MKISPLAPSHFPELPVVDGVRFASAAVGVKYKNRPDVMLVELAKGTAIAGVFTRSATRSAPVLDCEAKIDGAGESRAAILVNSGNSNAFTGAAGQLSVAALCAALSQELGVEQNRIFTASTGVIGVPLPHEKIVDGLKGLVGGLDEGGIADAARAIMTTDTFAKGAYVKLDIAGKAVTICGIAKGSGMIAPDMATMLVYLFTDALISRPDLQDLVSDLTDQTFNCITVDGDTSTSDTLICAATGRSEVDVSGDEVFARGLHHVMLDLAHQVVKDGEGATKFVEVRITGASDKSDAMQVARAIANSPLVKTAIAGEDPNWGRIVMAVGKSGAAADRDRLTIHFGDIIVAENGWVAPSYTEEAGANYMKQQELVISVDLGLGGGGATVWTCDLTHQYITINADYRS